MVEVGAITWRPVGIHFGNYKEILSVENLGNSVLITLARTALGTGVSVFATAYTAYFFTKQEMWGKKILVPFLCGNYVFFCRNDSYLLE